MSENNTSSTTQSATAAAPAAPAVQFKDYPLWKKAVIGTAGFVLGVGAGMVGASYANGSGS